MFTGNALKCLSMAAAVSACLFGSSAPALAQVDLAGPYAGIVAGTGIGSLTATNDEIDHRPSGGLFGGKAGFNLVRGKLLFGVEGDIAKSFIDGDDSITIQGFRSDVEHDLTMLTTIRGRVGGMAGRALFYGTGGMAVGRADGLLRVTVQDVEVDTNEVETTHTGWTLGGGFEVPINDRVSISGDYLRIDFASEDVLFNINGFELADEANLSLHVLRFGLNFRF